MIKITIPNKPMKNTEKRIRRRKKNVDKKPFSIQQVLTDGFNINH
jgi:hypothetical protein